MTLYKTWRARICLWRMSLILHTALWWFFHQFWSIWTGLKVWRPVRLSHHGICWASKQRYWITHNQTAKTFDFMLYNSMLELLCRSSMTRFGSGKLYGNIQEHSGSQRAGIGFLDQQALDPCLRESGPLPWLSFLWLGSVFICGPGSFTFKLGNTSLRLSKSVHGAPGQLAWYLSSCFIWYLASLQLCRHQHWSPVNCTLVTNNLASFPMEIRRQVHKS